MKNLFIFCYLCLTYASVITQSTGTPAGEKHELVPVGAYIVIKDKTTGTSSEAQRKFELTTNQPLPASIGAICYISA